MVPSFLDNPLDDLFPKILPKPGRLFVDSFHARKLGKSASRLSRSRELMRGAGMSPALTLKSDFQKSVR